MTERTTSRPYHKYVFDSDARRFVGAFEEMYRNEDVERYDSWNQDDVGSPGARLALNMLASRRYGRVLDLGCGKGAFTRALTEFADEVVGVDIAPTAVHKARTRYPGIDFRVADATTFVAGCYETFDLVVVSEVLSYVETWPELVRGVARIGRRLFLSLYLPPDPIGFVKSFADLRDVVARDFTVETEVVLNQERLLLLAGR